MLSEMHEDGPLSRDNPKGVGVCVAGDQIEARTPRRLRSRRRAANCPGRGPLRAAAKRPRGDPSPGPLIGRRGGSLQPRPAASLARRTMSSRSHLLGPLAALALLCACVSGRSEVVPTGPLPAGAEAAPVAA